MNQKKVKTYFKCIGIFIVMLFGIFLNITWCLSLFGFISWVLGIVALINLICHAADDEKEPVMGITQSYLRDEHMSEFHDKILYFFIIIILASTGYWMLGLLWIFIGIEDLEDRKRAENSKSKK